MLRRQFGWKYYFSMGKRKNIMTAAWQKRRKTAKSFDE